MIPYYLSAAKVFLRSGRANPGGHGDQAFSSGVTVLKCHFMRHEMAANLFLLVSGDPKWPKTSFWSFLATRNGRKPLFSRFWRPEMAANLFLVVSGGPKWPKTSFCSFLVTRNGQKPLFGRFRRKDAAPNFRFIPSKDGLRPIFHFARI